MNKPFLCRLGIHKWSPFSKFGKSGKLRKRVCSRCGKSDILVPLTWYERPK